MLNRRPDIVTIFLRMKDFFRSNNLRMMDFYRIVDLQNLNAVVIDFLRAMSEMLY